MTITFFGVHYCQVFVRKRFMGYLEEQRERAHQVDAERNAQADALDIQRCPYPSYKDPRETLQIARQSRGVTLFGYKVPSRIPSSPAKAA